MWISRNAYESLLKERSEAVGVAHALEQTNTTNKVTMDWLMVRLTQLEHERAQLIFNYMGVKIAAPSFEPAPESQSVGDILNAVPSFEDMGEEEAERQGIGWDDDGKVVYKAKK